MTSATVIKKPRRAADAPLPMLEGVGEAEPQPEPPFRIFVFYYVGIDKPYNTILSTPFDDVDSVERIRAVHGALERMHPGKRIVIQNWRAVEP